MLGRALYKGRVHSDEHPPPSAEASVLYNSPGGNQAEFWPAIQQWLCDQFVSTGGFVSGYARSAMPVEEFRSRIGKHFDVRKFGTAAKEAFLQRLHYCAGSYE